MKEATLLSLRDFSFASQFGSQYPREFICVTGAVKLAESETSVDVGLVEGTEQKTKNYLAGFHLPKATRFFLITKVDFAEYIGGTTESRGENERSERGVLAAGNVIAIDTVRQDAPVINIINSICIEAIRIGASDIHIESMRDCVDVRYRIDGSLRVFKKLDSGIFPALSNRVKIMADMNSMEKRMPQDGRITLRVGEATIDLRVSTMPISNGESIVLRIFNQSSEAMTIDRLGFNERDYSMIRESVRRPFGLILLTGPTGCGKTTTLHALLQTLPRKDLKIITIEDPVEHAIVGINQVQVNNEIGLGFDMMLRRVLRQDPNVIMVGEIRDRETADISLRSALTGHLILSTLHTNDSVSVITRLVNMGIEPYLIAAVLKCSVAQRLVRVLCPSCAKEAVMPRGIRSACERLGIPATVLKVPQGCPDCGNSGFRGRTIVSEVFEITGKIESMIAGGATIAHMRECATRNGMTPMAHDALSKLASGVTSLEEIRREVFLDGVI
jgi:general secretion pathway protein E/type IV pilus assembly protein PilB